jgi:hypothetical protein
MVVSAAARQPFTAEDLAMSGSAADEPADAPKQDSKPLTDEESAQIDEEIAAEDRKLIESGLYSREQLAKMYGMKPEDVGRPKLTKASIAKELAAIDKLRREDRRAYFADEALQQRERYLIEMRGKLAEKASASKKESVSADQDDGPGVDPALLKEWEEQGGVKHHLKVAQRTVEGIMGELDDEAAEQFQESFYGLPQGVQTSVYRYIGIDGGGSFKPASAEKLDEFGELSDEAAELVNDEWGDDAARKLGIAKGRVTLMLKSMSQSDREAAERWMDELDPPAQVAVMKALAG